MKKIAVMLDSRLYAASYDNSQSLGAGSVFSLNHDGSDRQILRTFSFLTGSMAYGSYGRFYRSPSGISLWCIQPDQAGVSVASAQMMILQVGGFF